MLPDLYIVDAFTDRPFAGNPAAVCLLAEPAEAPWMQRVAAEMNLSETAFVSPTGVPGRYDLRWFSPSVEVDLCGHATLASAHVLWESGREEPDRHLSFVTSGGPLEAVLSEGMIVLDFPSLPARERERPPGLAKALGTYPTWVGASPDDLLVELASAAEVRELQPDLTALAAFDFRGIIVTSAAPGEPYDFVSRFFAPSLGIAEDPVTGSAHCTLGPFWAARLGRTDLRGRQLSRRGGDVAVRVRGERVAIGGPAVTVLQGTLARGS